MAGESLLLPLRPAAFPNRPQPSPKGPLQNANPGQTHKSRRRGRLSVKKEQLCECYRYSNRPRRATIACFYMITQTTLSAATPASLEPRRVALRERRFVPSVNNLEARLDAGSVAQALLPVRSCRSEHAEPPHTAASHTPEILIANLELEFQLTHGKHSPLRIPNRKYLRVLRSPRRIGFPTVSLPLTYPESRIAQTDPRKPFSVASRSPLTRPQEDHRRRTVTAFLIYGTAIKTPRNPLNTQLLTFSNRR